LRHAAEVPEGVLQATQELISRLARDSLAVALARVAEHDAEDVRAPPTAVGQDQGRARAEVNLGLFSGGAFESAEGQFQGLFQLADEAAHAVVTAGEAVLGDQVLMDALRRQAEFQLGLDDRTPRFTVAGSTGRHWLLCRRRLRNARQCVIGAEGRNGWF
jgi:hypothetical protein